MVNKKGLKVLNRNEIILIILALIFVGYAFAATAFDASGIVAGGNYSSSILLNVTTDMNHTEYSYNVTFFYNASGGDAYLNSTFNNLTGTIWNETADDSVFNYTIDITTVLGGLTDARTYNISVWVDNGTDQLLVPSASNMTFDSTPPRVNFSDTTSVAIATNDSLVNNGNYSAADISKGFNVNVSFSDAIFTNYSTSGANVYINLTNATEQVNFTRALNKTSIGVFFNVTFNLSSADAYADGKYNITIYANDSRYLNDSSNEIAANVNNTEYIQIAIDRTAPSSITLAQSTSTTTTQNVITITASDATTGIDTCAGSGSGITITGTGTGTQTLTHTGLSCGTSYSYVVTCFDYVGNGLSTDSTSFSTSSCSTGDSPSGGGDGETTAVEKVNIFPSITPEAPVTISNFDESAGIEEMVVNVKEEADNVKITVKKFDTQPTEISVSKAGNVHKYLQITAENLGDKLDKATVTIKVQKNWLLDNEIDKANIALFRLDESAGKWNELSTVYKEEDDNYYYYNVQLTSFSYFAIAEKGAEEEEEEEIIGGNLLWLWIAIGVVLLAIIVGGGIAAKRKK